MQDKEHANTYMVQDLRSGEEVERLAIQDGIVTSNMGGVFPEQSETAILQLQQILDVGCGTGGWLRAAALLYPHIEKLVGVDISNKTILYAKKESTERNIEQRMFFFVMDALQMLQFPENTFDLVNLRLGVSFMRTWDWPKLLQEFQRVARPGAIVRIVDSEMGSQECSSSALTILHTYLQKAFYRSGHLFEDRTDGLTSYLPDLLTKHGCVSVKKHIFPLRYIGGSSETHTFRRDMELLYRTIRPFLKKWGALPGNYEEIYLQALEDMKQPDFKLIGNIVIAWGQKPGVFQPFPEKNVQTQEENIRFTERELQVIILVAQSFKNSQIADQLDISVKTVQSHLASAYAKMHFPTKGDVRMQIARYVLDKHLLDTEES